MLLLRRAQKGDLDEIRTLYERSRFFHLPWAHPPKDYGSYLSDNGRYFLCFETSGEIVGSFQISGIVRGYFQSAYLGYEVFTPYDRKGYMRIGLGLVIQEAFGSLNLHRLEANIQPGNIPSTRLVSGAGFVKEGYSKNYLNVGGKGWQDHERWALLNENWTESNS